MRLSPKAFDKFLGGAVRQEFLLRRRSACPCIDPASDQPKFNCPKCSGKGHIWADSEVEGFAGVTNPSAQKAMAIFGNFELGDCLLTVPQASPLYGARQYDRLRSKVAKTQFSIVMVPARVSKLLGKVVRIDRVFWLADDGVTVVDGQIPAVADDGALVWPTGGAPPTGKSYTVEGVKFDEYFVFIPLSTMRNSGVEGLPIRLAVRRLDVLNR